MLRVELISNAKIHHEYGERLNFSPLVHVPNLSD